MANYNSIHKGADIDAAVSFHKDNYVENSWTPEIKFNGNSVGMTYATQAGLYTKIGRKVTLTAFISLSAKGTSTGSATITGLPLTNNSGDGAYSAVTFSLSNISFANAYQGYIPSSTAYIVLNEITEDGAMTPLTNANFADNSYIMINVTYFTA